MSETNLRRSSRRREKKPDNNKYSEGMIVEITRDRIRSKGRLVSRLAAHENSSNPRWVVAFDEKSWPEEDMYESSFGKILGHATTDKNEQQTSLVTNGKKPNNDNNKTTMLSTPTGSPVAPSLTEDSSSSVSSSNNNNNADNNNGKTKTERKPTVETDETEKSDDSAARKKASDREARRKRREAVVEEEEVKVGVHGQSINHNAKKKIKGEDVISVPMLTGTLLLYRGPHRRAEFIYKK